MGLQGRPRGRRVPRRAALPWPRGRPGGRNAASGPLVLRRRAAWPLRQAASGRASAAGAADRRGLPQALTEGRTWGLGTLVHLPLEFLWSVTVPFMSPSSGMAGGETWRTGGGAAFARQSSSSSFPSSADFPSSFPSAFVDV